VPKKVTTIYVLLLLWDLTGKPESMLRELRQYIANESWERYQNRADLRLKVWFSDAESMTWGALYIWESSAARESEIESMHHVEAITGVAPAVRRLDLEAAQTGTHDDLPITELGLAFQGVGLPPQHRN
jgi:hypothetical protein